MNSFPKSKKQNKIFKIERNIRDIDKLGGGICFSIHVTTKW